MKSKIFLVLVLVLVSTSLRAQLSPEAAASRMDMPNSAVSELKGSVVMFERPRYNFSVLIYKNGDYKIVGPSGEKFTSQDIQFWFLETATADDFQSRIISLTDAWYYPSYKMVVFHYETNAATLNDILKSFDIHPGCSTYHIPTVLGSEASGYIGVPIK